MAVFCVRAKVKTAMSQTQGAPERKRRTCSEMNARTDKSIPGESRAIHATEKLRMENKKQKPLPTRALPLFLPSAGRAGKHTSDHILPRPVPSLPPHAPGAMRRALQQAQNPLSAPTAHPSVRAGWRAAGHRRGRTRRPPRRPPPSSRPHHPVHPSGGRGGGGEPTHAAVSRSRKRWGGASSKEDYGVHGRWHGRWE